MSLFPKCYSSSSLLILKGHLIILLLQEIPQMWRKHSLLYNRPYATLLSHCIWFYDNVCVVAGVFSLFRTLYSWVLSFLCYFRSSTGPGVAVLFLSSVVLLH